jgi:N-acetylmuramoyl-L-alanine amidase
MRLPAVPPGGHGLIKRLRAGATNPNHTSIVVEVTDPVVIERAAVTPATKSRPARLEVILAPLDEGNRFAGTIGTTGQAHLGLVQPPVPEPATTAAVKPRPTYRPLVVIDPGHGGHDSGAQKYGVNEKDVVLAFSIVLRDHLLKTGRYRVVMTRDTDIFLGLDRRREIAEEKGAALFIAVHADYANTRARGATIYSLRKRVANRLRETAAEEAAKEAVSDRIMQSVAAKPDDLGALKGILGDLAQREVHVNLERTNVFTQIAIDQMGAATTMRSQPHREAAFAVLKTAKVPSVLIELAYVSNRRDAARLQSAEWRREVASSLVTAVDKYFASSLSQIPQ